MGVLALHLWPDCSRELLKACLCHDLGESVTGDVPWMAKSDYPLSEALDRLECIALADMGMLFDLNKLTDQRRLKYLDRLDAYLWAKHHAPKLARGKKWRKARKWLKAERKEIA
jgi:5'-deoxynucleotidase YfbR-like HD superfamily hydrolase